MFVADNWKEYRLLDTDNGERLEKWGDYTLIRPDPQVIWKSEKTSKGWKNADGIYRRSRSGGGDWIKKDVPEEWIISYRDLKFGISAMGFKHTGLFPEQAVNWDWFRELIRNSGREIKLLNLFAYTGGASVAAAKEGAFVCHVDASKKIIQKAKRNAELSDIPQNKIRYIADDCFKFVAREIRRGNKYDAIILDPPSFGRGPNGEKWVIEECLDEFVELVCQVLSDDPLFVLLNSYTTGLSPATNGYILRKHTKRFGGSVVSEELGIPIEASGENLPCGAASRWTP